ncbi:MAG: DNA-directed RNA polymerase subunit beta [Actinobacteria bacterium]|nr:DNA-directed RNA polymerase subunit beta [Actinomycetota bacterium]MBA3565617.1 DNA-directed RNA polymerase subunit beta [Actinomycetota bacterium]MDQ3424667.1 DNA-directed RNA polymerase subunit beta [Actinomycetota bacterium]
MSSVAVAPRARKSFSRLKHVLDLPNLIDIQKTSFDWFMREGLRETIDDISPIEDYTGTLAVEFAEYEFGDPQFTIQECREKDLTYQVPLSITVRFVNKETGEIREQRVFMGDFPMMTPWGTFVINGTERVIVTQLVRSPGAYLMEPKDATKQVFMANLMPSRGSWLEVEIDKKGLVYARIDRKRKLPITTLLRALPAEDPTTGFALDTSSNEKILELFEGSVYIANTLEKDPSTREEEALIEVFKKQRPGEPPTLDNARNLLRSLFFDPKRYDLTRVGRYKLNQRLGVSVPDDVRVLTTEDIIALVRRLVSLPTNLGVPEDAKDHAAEAAQLSRDPIRAELDEYEDFGNRRLRTTGELIQEAFRVGLYRMERVVRERMTTEDVDTITPQTIINIRPVVAALKEFFGSSQLSQFMDQTNTLAGLTHRRRLSALGAGGLTRERAPIEVRDVHPTHYGRMCPIETPEGPNIGLIGSLASFATVSQFGFIQTPYRVVKSGKVTDEIIYLDAAEERQFTIAQASEPVDPKSGKFDNDQVLCRSREGEAVIVSPKDVEYMDVSPAQIVSVATALIPFLEHNDANRALMGANMQRQAVPLMIPQAPLVGTGLEFRAAVDTGDVVLALNDGAVVDVDAERIVVEGRGTRDEYPMTKFMRSNQGTLIHQKPVVTLGDKVKQGEVLADGSSTDGGELALGANLLVAFMPWEGFNFEDAIVISERLVKDDVLSSIHIHEYEIDARSTKLGDEEITRDIPNRSEESLANLDERGVVRIGAEAASGDLLVGKVTPKGETELTAEEKLIRAIFKEKAREVRDTSLKVPHGEGGKVIGVKTFARDAGDDLPPGVNELVRVYVAKKRKIAEGDKLAGRHGNKGVIAKIVPEEDMPFLEDGRPVDVVLNPLGVPSRMNIGQILETHLGWAAAHGVFPEGGPVSARAPINAPDPRSVATPVFDGATEGDVDDALVAWARSASNGHVQMGVDESAPRGSKSSGKVKLFDGKSGQPFDQEVTVGFMYILKLLHLVDDKIHARSTGPYSLVTQQPLGGKAQFGGQRFGEMEVWALEAYGAAYTLQEMLTIKSDDTIGRVKAYEAIVKGENIAEPSIPESFKVLLKEMQSLALDVQVLSDEGREVEVREEDDELLRAAEELGIDLSPGSLRAAVRQPTAEEVEEGGEAPDEAGELVLAADEELGDVDGEEPAVEVEVGEVEVED